MIDERLDDDHHPTTGEGRGRERSRSRTGRSIRSMLRVPGWGVALLAALTYLPALTAAPGRMPADTKLYLYLNPGRLVADAPFTWDTRQFAGWVPHQTIAYLWPSGPWFAAFEWLGVPDWIAHRLWLGTILFLGGLGVRWAARHLGLTAAGATVAGALYATSPYILPYVSRTSVMLLPWAAVGWLVGLTIRAASRTRWRDAALFALVVLSVGAVNATALALIAPAPVLWLLHAAWQHTITWRVAAITAAKVGTLSLLVSLWWIAMLLVQGRHGADVLSFSETLDAVSLTSVSTETLRGMGYWLFYVRDPYAFTTTASYDYMSSLALIAATWMLLAVSLVGLAAVRWSQRRYAALLVGTGVVLAVGVHPIDQPSPLMSPLRDSALGLALRSSTRALPLSTFGLALGAGALVTAVASAHLPARWAARPRRARVHRIGVAALGPAVVVLAVVSLPAMYTGGYVDPALERDADVPAAWTDAAAQLDAGSTEHRVMQLPGSEFGAFRWGYTVDPPLPGLTDKPLVTRDLLPLGSPAAMDLLYALDDRFQAGTVDPAAIAGVARFLGVDTIWLANDLAFDRFRTPRPETISAMFAVPPPGLGTPRPIGSPEVNVPDIAMLDEQQLSNSGADATIGQPLAPIELVDVDRPVAIVRATTRTVVLAGSGDGIVDAAAAGLLQGDEAVLYAGDLEVLDVDDDAVPADSLLIVTDSNRDRAMQWRGSQDVLGLTERGGPDPDATRVDVADQRLAATASTDADDQTVALLDPELEVSASSYGEPFAYRPEDRPSMAVDGDPSTAWRVADRFDPVGESIHLSSTDGTLIVLQDQHHTANRAIARVRIAVEGTAPMVVDLDERSLTAPGQSVAVAPGRPVTITIEAVVERPGGVDSGPSAVGFAELGPIAIEYTRLPVRPLDTVDTARPLAIVMTRERVRSTNRWRADPDPAMRRQFDLGAERTFDAVVTLRLDQRAGDAVLDALGGTSSPAVANRRLTGVAAARGAAAVDGDLATAWTTPFGQAVGSSVTVALASGGGSASLAPITITQPDDDQHTRITEVAVTSPALPAPIVVSLDAPDAEGTSELTLDTVQRQAVAAADSVTITITAVDGRTITDRRYAEQVQVPASINEIGGLHLAPPTPVAAPDCHEGVLTIDDTPVGLVFGADAASRLVAGETVEVATCAGPVLLGAGMHRLTSTPGVATGIDVDRVTLRSNLVDPADAPAPNAAPDDAPTDDAPTGAESSDATVLDVRRTRTVRQVTVAPCPTGCWLILGEGHNDAWTAAGPDGDLGMPIPVSGGFNGWWLPPDDGARTIEMRWTPQPDLNLALMAAFGAVLVCLLVAILDRRVLRQVVGFEPPVLELIAPRRSRRASAVAALALVVLSAVAIEPAWGVVALVPAVAMLVVARPRLFVWSAAAGAVMLGMWMVRRQHAYRYFADAAWPVRFDDLHAAGLFVVILVVAGSLADERGTTDVSD